MSELLTVAEVAQILGVGEDTVTRRFAKVKGVIDLGSPETPKRRRYRVLRIPKSVVEKFLLTRGGPVEITTPARPPKRKARGASDPPDEDEIVRQLAGMTKQHGAAAQLGPGLVYVTPDDAEFFGAIFLYWLLVQRDKWLEESLIDFFHSEGADYSKWLSWDNGEASATIGEIERKRFLRARQDYHIALKQGSPWFPLHSQ